MSRRPSSFWFHARELLADKPRLFGAAVMALISAGGLGVGLLGMASVIKNILGEDNARDLPMLVSDLNEKIGGRIPAEWIASLPAGPYKAVLYTVIALGLLAVVGAAANFLHQYLSITVCTTAVGRIRARLFDHLIRLPLTAIVGERGADLTSRIVVDTRQLNQGFQAFTSKAPAQILKGAAALITAVVLEWRLTIAVVIVGPIMYTVIRKLAKRVKRATKSAMKSRAGLMGVMSDVISGFRVVKVHGAEPYETHRFHSLNHSVVTEQLKVRTAKALASPLIELGAIIVIGAIAIVFAKAIIDGKMDPSNFVVAISSIAIAGNSLKPLSLVVQDIHAADAAASRIDRILDIEPEHTETESHPPLKRHKESIEFEHVSLTYPGREEPALDDISLSIKHGQRVAFVGPNGSGKTTLLSLIPRLLEPSDGRVRIDDKDIASVSIASLRAQLAVVTQETILFRGTIAENIAYAQPDATRAQIERAAEQAHALEFITSLPCGYDTPVADAGLSLSGGQRQRIAIARAMLRDPAILIMDEATSMIDADSESQIAAAIAEFSHNRTCLVVAHRLATVLGSDRIVVLDQGRLIDSGTHEQLLERCTIYQQLAATQLTPPANRTTQVSSPRPTSPTPSQTA